MITLLSLWRVLGWIGAIWRDVKVRKGGRKRRWPDKSAAVVVGAGDWNKRIFCAVARLPLLALSSFFAVFSIPNAPSGFGHSKIPAIQK